VINVLRKILKKQKEVGINMGALTKKDFIQFAIQLSYIGDDTARRELMKSQIELLKQTNPRFDAHRFESYVENLVKKKRLGI